MTLKIQHLRLNEILTATLLNLEKCYCYVSRQVQSLSAKELTPKFFQASGSVISVFCIGDHRICEETTCVNTIKED